MRTAIITLTGIAIGIIVGISSIPIKTTNTTPIHQSFTTPAINSMGYVVDSNPKNIFVSFNEHVVRFEVTNNTKVDELIFKESKNGEQVSTSIDKIINKTIYITYSEIDEKIFADKIIVLK